MNKKSLSQQIYEARWCYLFVLPCSILTGMFVLYPIGMSWYFSLLDWSGFTKDAKFIGLQNYAEAINDPFFWNAFSRSFIFMFGTVPVKIILGFMISTAFLSMWITNTATAVMMLPIGIAVVKQIKDLNSTKENENLVFGKALMLSIAFSASIGGVSTLIGTPPNLILATVIEETYGVKITFKSWMTFAFPFSVILLIISWYYLTRVAFNFTKYNFKDAEIEINKQLNDLGKLSYEEKLISAIFSITAILWIFRDFFEIFLPNLDDSIIAIFSATTLFLFNSKSKKGNLMKWDEAVKLPWGILLLFGGGLAIASAFQSSGLAIWIGESLFKADSFSLIILLERLDNLPPCLLHTSI